MEESTINGWKTFGVIVIILLIIAGLYFGVAYLTNTSYKTGYTDGVSYQTNVSYNSGYTNGYTNGVYNIVVSQLNQSVLYYIDDTIKPLEIKPIPIAEICSRWASS